MTLDDVADHLAATNGHVAELRQHVHDLTTRLDAPQLAQAILPDLELDDQVTMLLHAKRPEQWCTDAAVRCLAAAWPDARKRLLLATAARKCGVQPAQLAALVEQWQGEQTLGEGEATVDAYPLLTTDYALRQDVIADVLPAGCTLLAGNAKDGKSLLAYHLAACVATGKPFLGQFPVERGEVLFFALEDGERRGQERLRRQCEQLGITAEDLRGRIAFRFWDAPKLGLGFETFLTQWLADHPQTRLVIIDILEKIRPPRAEFAELYRTGYATTAPLTRVAQEQNVALLVVHHSNKNPHSDPRLLVSGPMSVLGGADNAWLLRRPYGESEAELIIAGRDIPEQEWALHFQDGLWSLEGTLGECRMSRERREVLEVLQEERAGMKPYQLALAMGKKASSMRSLLRKMRDEGQVAVQEEGRYTALVRPLSSVNGPLPRTKDEGPLTLPGIAGGGVHGVHGVAPAPACTDASEAGTPPAEEDPPWEEEPVHTGNSVHAAHTDDSGHADTGRHGDDAGHGEHARHAVHTHHGAHPRHADHAVHADDARHPGHAVHADHAGHGEHGDTGAHPMSPDHTDHPVHAVHAEHGAHADHVRHAVHAPPLDEGPGQAEEPDPFLDPDDWLAEPPPRPSPVDHAAHAPSAALASTAPPDERPLQATDWIWPCVPSGARASQSPWEVVEITTNTRGQPMAACLTATGKVNLWPLAQCQRAPQPEDAR